MRARVTIGAAAIFAVALGITAFVILRLVAGTMVSEAQRNAEVQARNLAVLAELGRLPDVLDVDISSSVVLQVTGSDGRIIAASEQLQDMPPILTSVPEPGVARATTVRLVPAHHDEADYRIVALGTRSADGEIAVIAGVSLAEATTTLTTLGRVLAGAFTFVLLAVAALIWIVVARALRPVERIRREVDAITEVDLASRVSVPDHRDEVHRLATTMNRMLERLQAAADKQQSFIADASHELRSPLASLRTQLEVTAAHPQGMDVGEVATDALADIERIQALTQDLLLLTRVGATNPQTELCEINELVAQIVEERSETNLTFLPGPPVYARVNRSQVHRLLTNLLDNAARHATSSVTARCEGGDEITVIIADDGPGIAPADRERVFDRFVRLDEPRTRSDGGTGLGLAIAREIAWAHGGDLRLAPSGVGATFVLTLPLAAPE